MTYGIIKNQFHLVKYLTHEINGILIDSGVNESAEYQRMWCVSEQ